MTEASEKFLIETVCALTTDAWTLQVAEWAAMKPGGRAAEYLHHYLAGTGLEKQVDILALLREDAGVKQTVEREILLQLKQRGVVSGAVPLPQRVFQNRDWQYAIGSINLEWRRNLITFLKGEISVELAFRNLYRWHPKEYRITQCLHQAAENLKQSGAKDFWIKGPTVTYRFRQT